MVTVTDGAGRWRSCRWQAGEELEPFGAAVTDPTPWPAVTVAFALTKGTKADWTVQKLTELGVETIVPFVAERSVVRWEAQATERHVARWRHVAREAAMQSRRTRLAAVSPVVPFAEVAGLAAAVLAEPGGAPPTLARPVVLIGPEGGWSAEELACGLPTVGLGPTVLRAETAAVAAAAVLLALRAGLVAEAQ